MKCTTDHEMVAVQGSPCTSTPLTLILYLNKSDKELRHIISLQFKFQNNSHFEQGRLSGHSLKYKSCNTAKAPTCNTYIHNNAL